MNEQEIMLITISDLKFFLNIVESTIDLDNFIQSCIDAAISDSARYANQELTLRTYTLYKYGNGKQEIYLPNKPITEIISIKNMGGKALTDDYTKIIINGSKLLFTDGIFTNELLIFIYKSGYTADTVPADLKQALIELAADKFLNSFQANESRFGLTATNWNAQGGGGKSFESGAERSNYFYRLFDNYRILKI